MKKNVHTAPSGRIYIFTSILTCDECGHKLNGCLSQGIYYYRCGQRLLRGRCTHNHSIREDYVERWLFDHLGEEFDRVKLDWEIQAAKRKRSSSSKDKAVLKRKLNKLKELYVNDLIDIEEYRKDYEIYTSALEQMPNDKEMEQPPNFKAVERLLQSDFKNLYNTLTREEKRTLWRSAIKEIRIDNDYNITGIIFE